MAVKMNLWSLTLLPGEKYPIYVRRDFQITNAALGEDLKSADGRSVVKVTHNPIPSRALESDDEYDSEFDSEFDDEELDSDLEGDELEDQEEEEADDEDDEEMDEDDEDDDSDFSEDEIEETNVICSLTAGKVEQSIVNLTFVEGDVVMFEVTGENAVHLLGNYIDQFPDISDDEDSEFSGEDDYSDIYGSDDDDEIELDTDEEEAIAKITEIPDEKPKKAIAAAKKEKAEPAAAAAPAKAAKRKADEIESPAPKAAATAAKAADVDTEGLSKNQKKKLAKKAKTEEAAPAAAAAAPAPKKGGKRTLPSGLVIEDVKLGDGPVAKGGKRLGMRYIGKLTNGKQFDANTSGKPFSFVLGRGEVIKGWDEGLAGMAVGGERKLSIPPQLAYGNQKIPGIPKGSTLNFEVKLVSVA
ncbi:FK506-binding protein 4 [Kwoniella heveanensis CBS 569]|nr:FK506-binding protein 4 [Kwoniella heveanensis CBS 569]